MQGGGFTGGIGPVTREGVITHGAYGNAVQEFAYRYYELNNQM